MTDDHPGLEAARRWAAHHHIEDIPLPPEPPDAHLGESSQDGTLLDGMITAAELDAMTFAPLVEHVPYLITEGLGILAGPPKAGKSWLADGIALACAHGGTALGGIDVQPRHVLLLALEDGP